MENGEEEGKGPVSAFKLRQKMFEQQQTENNIKPTVGIKPKVGKLGGGGELNIIGSNKPDVAPSKPGINRPGNIARTKPELVNRRDKSPNAPTSEDGPPKKRNSSVNIPSAFRKEPDSSTPAPPAKPKPKLETKPKSDANNNADSVTSPVIGTKPAISAMKPALKSPGYSKPGNVSPRDTAQTSPRSTTDGKGGQVSALANAMAGLPLNPVDLKRNLRPAKPDSDKPTGVPKKVPLNIRTKSSDSSNIGVELRSKFGGKTPVKRGSVKSVIRSSDKKKFRKVDGRFITAGAAPAKPDKLDCELDLDNFIEEFNKQLKAFEVDSPVGSGVTEFEEEEEYDDIANVRRETSASSRAISIIQPMTEEDEMEWEGAGFPGLEEENSAEVFPPPPPEELYDEGFSATVPVEDTADELYEPLPDDDDLPPQPPPPVGPKSVSLPPPPVPEPPRKASESSEPPPTPRTKEAKEAEKERKKREKEEREKKKKEEELQKKKENELKKLLKTYDISAEEIVKSVGKGIIKRTAKAGDKKCLAVVEGEKVDIIRMAHVKAKGKWLVRLDNSEKVGYVEADNIEVDTDAIRSLMESKGGNPTSPTSSKSPVPVPDDGEELYEPIDDLPNGTQGYEEDVTSEPDFDTYM